MCGGLLEYNEIYILNLGTRKYLNISTSGIALSETPVALKLASYYSGFYIGAGRARLQMLPAAEAPVGIISHPDKSCIFELRNNYALSPADEEVRELLKQSEVALHGVPVGVKDIADEQQASPMPEDIVSVVNTQGIALYRGRYDALPSLPRGIYLLQTGKQTAKKIIIR